MTTSSEDEEDDEEEGPPVKASPFSPNKERSRSRHRRRRRRSEHHRGEHKSEKTSHRRSSRADDHCDDGKRKGTRSTVPEPPDPPRRKESDRTRPVVPEPPAPPRERGPSSSHGYDVRNTHQGGKGKAKGNKWRCKICKNKVAPYQSALEQHQYLNEWCIEHQLWDGLAAWEKSEPGSWPKCREKALGIKCGRNSEAVENGFDLPSEDDYHAPGPAAGPSSSRGRMHLRSVPRIPVEQPPVEKVESQVVDHSKKKKKTKKRRRVRTPNLPDRARLDLESAMW